MMASWRVMVVPITIAIALLALVIYLLSGSDMWYAENWGGALDRWYEWVGMFIGIMLWMSCLGMLWPNAMKAYLKNGSNGDGGGPPCGGGGE